MKRIKNTLYFIVIIGFLIACVTTSKTTKNPILQKEVKEYIPEKTVTQNPHTIEFNFLQLNDVYEIAPIQGGKYGGMARVATIHKKLLEENPNTFLLLAGDFLNPSLLGTIKVEGERLRGKQMVDVMNYMNFDLVAFGNHEFDLSYNDLQKRLNESNFEWISANVMHNKKGKNFYFEKVINGKKQAVNDSFVQEITDSDGTKIKIGFISVCIPSNPKSYVAYGDIFTEATRSYLSIKNTTDVIFGLTHVKINQDRKIAEQLPEIPLIMGGHEHTNQYEKVGNTLISKADANAKTAYIHRISYHTLTKKITIKSELISIDSSIPEDPEIALVVAKWQKHLETKMKEIIDNPNAIIYKTNVPLEGRDTPIRSIQTNLGKVVTQAMSFAFNNTVDCALVNGGSIRLDDVLEGAITPVDVFRVLPYGGAIFKVAIKGSLLKKVLDFGEKSNGTGAYLQRYNVDKIGGKWQVKNQLLDTTKVYNVAFSDYLLKGFDIPFLSAKNTAVLSIYKPLENELGSDIRKAVIQYLQNQH